MSEIPKIPAACRSGGGATAESVDALPQDVRNKNASKLPMNNSQARVGNKK